LSINADTATRGWDVIYRNPKVQKAPKQDFWTYCIGCVCGKNSLRDSGGELFSINADTATRGWDVIYWNQKALKHDFWTYCSVLGAFLAKTHFATPAANFCQLMPTLPLVGALFLTGTKKFKKHQNMIFGHLGVYWVRWWQKLTSRLARRTFVN
jgi:hypothetical protein